MTTRRIKKVNSLLREVIAEVIREEVKNPAVSSFTSVTEVDVSRDLQSAKVFVSIIEDKQAQKEATLAALTSAAGYIAALASKKVVLRHFPVLFFKLDDSYERYIKIANLLEQITHDDSLGQ